MIITSNRDFLFPDAYALRHPTVSYHISEQEGKIVAAFGIECINTYVTFDSSSFADIKAMAIEMRGLRILFCEVRDAMLNKKPFKNTQARVVLGGFRYTFSAEFNRASVGCLTLVHNNSMPLVISSETAFNPIDPRYIASGMSRISSMIEEFCYELNKLAD